MNLTETSERERDTVQVTATPEKSAKDKLEIFWQTRACWVCEKIGPCQHREDAANWAL